MKYTLLTGPKFSVSSALSPGMASSVSASVTVNFTEVCSISLFGMSNFTESSPVTVVSQDGRLPTGANLYFPLPPETALRSFRSIVPLLAPYTSLQN